MDSPISVGGRYMIVNGTEVIVGRRITIKEFLEEQGYDVKKVAVERNGTIVPKCVFDTEAVSDEDKIEIVCFVGGG